MTDVSRRNLLHVLANMCEDPDCEIHNPTVGLEEEAIDETHLAFYMAGAYAMLDLVSNAIDNGLDSAIAELKDQLNLNGPIEPQSLKAPREDS